MRIAKFAPASVWRACKPAVLQVFAEQSAGIFWSNAGAVIAQAACVPGHRVSGRVGRFPIPHAKQAVVLGGSGQHKPDMAHRDWLWCALAGNCVWQTVGMAAARWPAGDGDVLSCLGLLQALRS